MPLQRCWIFLHGACPVLLGKLQTEFEYSFTLVCDAEQESAHESCPCGAIPKRVKTLQAALPCLLYAEPSLSTVTDRISVLDLRGGTDAPMAPSIGYLQHVFVPMLRRLLGLSVDLQVGQLFHALLCAAITLPMLSSNASVLNTSTAIEPYGGPDAAMAAVISSLQQVPMYMLRRLYKLITDLRIRPCQDHLMCLTSEQQLLYCGVICHVVAAYCLKEERRQHESEIQHPDLNHGIGTQLPIGG